MGQIYNIYYAMMYMNRGETEKKKGQVAVMEYRISGRTGNMRSVLNMAERKIANVREKIADFRKEWKQEQDMWNPYGGAYCGKETAGPSEEAIMACAKADLEFEIATMFWEIV